MQGDRSRSLLHSIQKFAFVPASPFVDDKSCWSLLQPASSACCAHINSTALGIHTSWCQIGLSSGIILMESNASASRKQDVFRVRLVGTTVELLEVTYCSNNLAIAPYSLTHSGQYAGEVLHLHSNYAIGDPSPINVRHNLVAATFELETRNVSHLSDHAFYSSVCTQLDSPGKWLNNVPGNPLSRTCFHEDYKLGCLPRDVSVELGKSGLSWWQPGCKLMHLTSRQIERCLAPKKLCLFGDSHMRFLSNTIVDLIERSFGKTPPEHKGIKASDLVTYYEDFWGWATPIVADDHDGCTTILRNTGAWHVAFSMSQAGRSKPDLLDYSERVSSIAKSLHQAQGRGQQVLWMTTNGQPVNLGVHTFEKYEHKDYRIDPMLLALNRVANNVMAASNISIFDTWSMTSPVADTSFDGIHFAGDVGYFIAMRLLSSICHAEF